MQGAISRHKATTSEGLAYANYMNGGICSLSKVAKLKTKSFGDSLIFAKCIVNQLFLINISNQHFTLTEQQISTLPPAMPYRPAAQIF